MLAVGFEEELEVCDICVDMYMHIYRCVCVCACVRARVRAARKRCVCARKRCVTREVTRTKKNDPEKLFLTFPPLENPIKIKKQVPLHVRAQAEAWELPREVSTLDFFFQLISFFF